MSSFRRCIYYIRLEKLILRQYACQKRRLLDMRVVWVNIYLEYLSSIFLYFQYFFNKFYNVACIYYKYCQYFKIINLHTFAANLERPQGSIRLIITLDKHLRQIDIKLQFEVIIGMLRSHSQELSFRKSISVNICDCYVCAYVVSFVHGMLLLDKIRIQGW